MASTHGRSTTVALVGLGLAAWLGAAALAAQPVLPSGPDITVNLGGGDVFNPQVAVFPDGGFVVAWTVGDFFLPDAQTVIRARLFAGDGTPRSGEISLLHPFNQRIDALAVTPDGGFWMAWEQLDRHHRSLVLARRYDSRGKPLTAPFVVHAPSAFGREGATLAAAPDGGAVVTWGAQQPAPSGGFFESGVVRFFGPEGTPRSPEIDLRLPECTPCSPEMDLGRFVTATAVAVEPDGSAWVLHPFLRADFATSAAIRRVAADGTVGPALDICRNSQVCEPAGFTYPFLEDPTLAMRQDGSLVVAWTYNTGASEDFSALFSVVQGRLFGADGAPLGEAFQVNRLRDHEIIPRAAALPDGRFVVIWQDQAENRSTLGVLGRSFAADGTPTSRQFPLPLGHPGSIAAGEAGNVVAALQTFDPAGSTIVVRLLASR